MRNTILLLLGILIFTQCTSRKQPPTPETGDGWLIPVEDIANLGVSPDPIKSIDHPVFIPLAQSDLKGSEPVYVLKLDNVIKVYPLSILQAHEIVNDSVSGNYFAVTYCPVTASGLLWSRKIRGVVTEFGVSGMLYHENLMPYDRHTKSYWSQMRMDCVHGEYIGGKAVTGFLLRTTLETVRNSFPYARILTDNNGQKGLINRKYNKLQQMIPEYFGLPGRTTLLFSMNDFNDSIRLIRTKSPDDNFIVAGSRSLHFITAYLAEGKTFTPLQHAFPLIMKDHRGNVYDVFGEVRQGPDSGSRLQTPPSFWAKDWAWEAFYPELPFVR